MPRALHPEREQALIQQRAILNLLQLSPVTGLSRNELSRALGYPLQSICGRIGELKKNRLVTEGEPRRDPFTHRLVKPVRVAAGAAALMDELL